MYQHIVVIGSSYQLGERIAWHFADLQIGQAILSELSEKTKDLLGRPDYSIHKLSTDSKSWHSVVEKDSFFADMRVYEDLDLFLKVLYDDKKISALDIAKTVLSFQPMTNLKLQKMIYLVYADYLTKTREKLFQEPIVAFTYGPAVREVYDYYKNHGREEIRGDGQVVKLDEITIPVALAKIMQSDDVRKILTSIKETLARFGYERPAKLVNLTHIDGGPWSRTPVGQIISDELISEYHHIETN